MAVGADQSDPTFHTFLIWDQEGPGPKGPWVKILWCGFNEAREPNTISIPDFVEHHGDSLRKQYLAWIYELGETRIHEKRLIDHFMLKDGFSYWWMTLFAEKSPYKSPISDAIRLLALEKILNQYIPRTVRLISTNRILHKIISGLCENEGIGYEWKRPWFNQSRFDAKKLYKRLPNPIRAAFSFLRHVLARWPLKAVGRNDWFDGDNSVFLCSYFIHLDQKSCSNGKFYSRQWEVLPRLLHDSGFYMNWIHHFLKSSVVPNTRVARKWVTYFNREPNREGSHAFLDTFLSWRILVSVVKGWLKLLYLSLKLGSVRGAFRPKDSNISLWPLMRMDWYDSIRGTVAVRNLFWIELFDAVMRILPHQRMGLYLCENQGWERALIHAWRKHGHGRLIGVVHATVRFWDLRHFFDQRLFQENNKQDFPQPDHFVLNGKAAVNEYLQGGILSENIVECEALRFLHLGEMKGVKRTVGAFSGRVLVLGGVMHKSTDKLLKLLEAAARLVPNEFRYTVKPHPHCMIEPANYSSVKMEVIHEPLGGIMNEYDIAYAANTTSAAVDAYLAGLHVVVMLDENELNLSPLREHSGVQFVSTAEELAKFFRETRDNAFDISKTRDFFFLNRDLPRWRSLLLEATSGK